MKSNNFAEQLNSLREAAKARLAEIEAEAAELRSALGDGPVASAASFVTNEVRPVRKARVTVIPPAETKPRRSRAPAADTSEIETKIAEYLAGPGDPLSAEAIASAIEAETAIVSKALRGLVSRNVLTTIGQKRGTRYALSAVDSGANGIATA